jgi:hypothetical protein
MDASKAAPKLGDATSGAAPQLATPAAAYPLTLANISCRCAATSLI